MNDIKRIGWACKYLHHDQSQKKKILEEIQRPLQERATTVAWLNRQSKEDAEQRLWDIMEHNVQAFYNLVSYIGSLPDELRMVRLGSSVLPVYTEPTWSYFWQRSDVREYCAKRFGKVGDLARALDVRLSMHPGQFTVLASDNDDIVNRSIEEFEYHADLIRWMGYGRTFQDFKCNVHISGRRGPQGIKDALKRLSPEARNSITIENDEMCWGTDASLELVDHCALVLDIHHEWVREGHYITPQSDRFKRIMDSWQGVRRPVIHYSLSREDLLNLHPTDQRPNMDELLNLGYKKTKLRAHSDFMWNTACNDWALEFWEYADIMVESKAKNLASIELYKYAVGETNELFEQNVRQKQAVSDPII